MSLLHFDVAEALAAILAADEPCRVPDPAPPADEPALFAECSPSWSRLTGLGQAIGCSAYAAYARLSRAPALSRERAAAVAGDRAATLHWYLTVYGAAHPGFRLPLSRDDIVWLLEPQQLEEMAFAVPRVVLWQALAPHGTAPSLAGGAGTTERDLAVWWLTDGALRLNVEDCLVPAAYRELLCSEGQDALRRVARVVHSLDSAPDEEAAAWIAAGLVRYPGLAACMPRAQVDAVFAGGDGALARWLAAHGYAPDICEVLRRRFEDAAARAGFDLRQWVFVTKDAQGNRRFGPPQPVPAAPSIRIYAADVSVVGPVRQRSGLAHAARMSIETFRRMGVTVKVEDFRYGFPSPSDPALVPDMGPAGPAPAAVFHVNPNMLPLAFAAENAVRPERRAGYFFWELDRPALCDFLGLDLVHEVWTASHFVEATFRPYHQGVVDCVGLAMPPPPVLDRARARTELRTRLSVPEDALVFVSVFDGLSYVERKNPMAAIRAFQDAFSARSDVILVLKTHNRPAGYIGPQGGAWAAIDAACAADPRIRLMAESLPHAAILDLIAGADAYVSLHRAEGWGLGPAEAMALGTPVIVTAYSGTEDFCDDETSFRVRWTPRAVAPTDYVHVDPGRQWAEPDHGAAVQAFRQVVDDAAARQRKATAAQARIAETMSFETVGRRYIRALERLLAGS